MSPSSSAEPQQGPSPSPAGEGSSAENPAFIRLAMRNMVRKGRQSLLHFALTAAGLLGFLVLLSWLGRPQLPGG